MVTEATTSSIRVLLVDDQDLIRTGFSMILGAESDISVVGTAADGIEALEVIERDPGALDVVLMDIRMPRQDGIETTRILTRDHPELKVLLLTTFDLDEYAFEGLRAGASGFLVKDTKPAELAEALRRVAVGDAVISARITRRLLDMFAPDLPGAGLAGATGSHQSGSQGAAQRRVAELTPREREVLALIGRGMTNSEIAAELVVSETTVKTHVGNILHKTASRDRVQVAILAYRAGLVSDH